MSDINKVIVTGRVTRDSELRQTPNGTAVTDVSVASNRIWSKNGDRQEWETDEGVKRSKLTVVAENVNLTPNGGGKNNSQQAAKVGAGAGASDDMPF